MSSITIHPKNKEQENAITRFLRAFDIPFAKSKVSYDPEFVQKIRESEQQIKEGKTTRIRNKKELEDLLGLNDEA